MKFSSQRKEMLLFLTTNMVSVRSRANKKFHKLQSDYCFVLVFFFSDVFIS